MLRPTNAPLASAHWFQVDLNDLCKHGGFAVVAQGMHDPLYGVGGSSAEDFYGGWPEHPGQYGMTTIGLKKARVGYGLMVHAD